MQTCSIQMHLWFYFVSIPLNRTLQQCCGRTTCTLDGKQHWILNRTFVNSMLLMSTEKKRHLPKLQQAKIIHKTNIYTKFNMLLLRRKTFGIRKHEPQPQMNLCPHCQTQTGHTESQRLLAATLKKPWISQNSLFKQLQPNVTVWPEFFPTHWFHSTWRAGSTNIFLTPF